MHTSEKIIYAQKRINELEVLIKHWQAKLANSEQIIAINNIKQKESPNKAIAA